MFYFKIRAQYWIPPETWTWWFKKQQARCDPVDWRVAVRTRYLWRCTGETYLQCNAMTPDILNMRYLLLCVSIQSVMFSMSPFFFLHVFFTNAANRHKIFTPEQLHIARHVLYLPQHKATPACKNPPWAELNLYSAPDYNSTQLVFLNRLSVLQKPIFPSPFCAIQNGIC